MYYGIFEGVCGWDQTVRVGFCILYEEFSGGDREREGVGGQAPGNGDGEWRKE